MKTREKKFFFLVLSSKVFKVAIVVLAIFALFLSNLFKTDVVSTAFVGGSTKKLPIYCVETSSKQVALTFDAAWGSEKTEQILNVLAEQDVAATFFLVGFWVDKNEDLVKKIDAQNLQIGTHSNTHPDFTKLSPAQMGLELSTSVQKIEKLISKKVTLFRAPFGAYNNAVLQSAENANLQTIQWDVDSLDWKGISSQKIVENVITKFNVIDKSELKLQCCYCQKITKKDTLSFL